MKYGFISNIRGDWQNLELTLDFLLNKHKVDKIINLGNIIGFNVSGIKKCIEQLRNPKIINLLGEYDLCIINQAFYKKRFRNIHELALEAIGRPYHRAHERSFRACRKVLALDDAHPTAELNFLRSLPQLNCLSGGIIASHGLPGCEDLSRPAETTDKFIQSIHSYFSGNHCKIPKINAFVFASKKPELFLKTKNMPPSHRLRRHIYKHLDVLENSQLKISFKQIEWGYAFSPGGTSAFNLYSECLVMDICRDGNYTLEWFWHKPKRTKLFNELTELYPEDELEILIGKHLDDGSL